MKPAPSAQTHPTRTPPRWRVWATAPALHWLGLLLLCAAYLQGGVNKLTDFGGAVAEMQHFGLSPAAPLAAAVILGELGAALLVLSGRLRWLGALGLALFTVAATCIANRYWQMQGMERFMAANSFYEHLGLAGAFLLVAWHDLRTPQKGR
ncbi:DoxX family protein [Massilia sp. MB5]|uniref:DoxX family protein n=1 Tax=Massilia sp. MB5 TaxID=2919578 RepID=UPI001F0E9A39|nr:DoxX family protein [Massilia sp. MB5]UMR32501.1 DoxX family protein [Massilia sp. MB5]